MTQNSEQNRALNLLGGNEQTPRDLQHIFNAVDAATARGFDTTIDGLWLNGISSPLSINVLSPDGMWTREADVLDEEASLALADIEVQRYENTPLDLLTTREIVMREGIYRTGISSPESVRLGISDTLRGLGGVAVLSGNDFALHVAGDIYQSLRQGNR